MHRDRPRSSIVGTARARAAELADLAGATDEVDRVLARAVDQFIVQTPTGPTAVAGYPWFGEWSRDLFTSYEGLFLCTGRTDEGREVLMRAAATVSEGMLANTADVGTLEYNTIDATLWFVHALHRHIAVTGDVALGDALADTLVDILAAHRDGTRFGIGVDRATGLLRGGADGWALTWMDARVDGRPITARAGFPVEIQALWINALAASIDILRSAGRATDDWDELLKRARSSFPEMFELADGSLADTVDESGIADPSCRPNQLLAASLPFGPVVDAEGAARIVDRCGDLVTSLGMRSLSPDDPAIPGSPPGAAGRARRRLSPGNGVAVADRTVRRRHAAALASTPRVCSTDLSCISPKPDSVRSRRPPTATPPTSRPVARSRPGRSPNCIRSRTLVASP